MLPTILASSPASLAGSAAVLAISATRRSPPALVTEPAPEIRHHDASLVREHLTAKAFNLTDDLHICFIPDHFCQEIINVGTVNSVSCSAAGSKEVSEVCGCRV